MHTPTPALVPAPPVRAAYAVAVILSVLRPTRYIATQTPYWTLTVSHVVPLPPDVDPDAFRGAAGDRAQRRAWAAYIYALERSLDVPYGTVTAVPGSRSIKVRDEPLFFEAVLAAGFPVSTVEMSLRVPP